MEKLRWQLIQGHISCWYHDQHTSWMPPSQPNSVVPPCASLQLGMLNITLSEAGCLRTLPSLEPKSTVFNLLRITQRFTVFLEETFKDFLAQFHFFPSWLWSLFQPPQHGSSCFCHSLLKPSGFVSSPSCSSAGTRLKVTNPSEFISSGRTLCPAPDVGISHPPAHSLAGSWHTGGCQQWYNATKSFLGRVLPHPHPEKPSFVFLTPTWPSKIPNFTKEKLSLFCVVAPEFSDAKNAEVGYANIYKRDSHIRTYCDSLMKKPKKKKIATTCLI